MALRILGEFRMANDPVTKIQTIMQFYRESPNKPRWSKTRREFTELKANAFFVWVMLNQGQLAERADNAADYLVNNYFRETGNFWAEIADTRLKTIKVICQTGYEGKAFALRFASNSFPYRLKAAAKKIVSDYDSDVRKIWNKLAKEDVDKIYCRFKEFEGIGDALARMAQFSLVRKYGVAGGKASKKYMSVKPDVHVQRVLFRLGICEQKTPRSVMVVTNDLNLRSPADFDWAVWKIGKLYCHSNYPECFNCPLEQVCEQRGLQD